MATNGSKNKIFPISTPKGQSGAIGIDFGTTYSSVGVWQHGRVEIIANQKGNRATPSCVSFTKTGHLTGDDAKNQIGINPANTIYGAKRLLGRSFSDAQVQNDMKRWPFKVVAGPGNEGYQKPMIVVTDKGEEKQFSAEEISAMVLTKMKEFAESYIDSKVTNAVVTVPAHFNPIQYEATKGACALAGLNDVHLVNEPTAAAVAYAFDQKRTPNIRGENIVVFDIVGGTLDVSVITIKNNVFQVKAISGNQDLGGDDKMVTHFTEEFKRKHGKDIGGNPRALARLRNACERAKMTLFSVLTTSIEIYNLSENIDFFSAVTRSLIKKLSSDLLKNCKACVSKCMKDAKMNKHDIDNVLLVGRSCRIPMVQQMFQNYFKGKNIYNFKSMNPDEAVAYGAAILSEMWTDKNTVNSNRTGVTPLSLGVRVYDGGMSVVIPKNTPNRSKKMRVYTTVWNNQTKVKFPIYEGENSIAKKNTLLDEIFLADIPPQPARSPNLDVYFDINGDGILTVSAEHRGTTNRKQIKIIVHTVVLLEAELQRMLEEVQNSVVTNGSHQMKLVETKTTNNNLKEFAGLMLKCFQKKFKDMGIINCFAIRD